MNSTPTKELNCTVVGEDKLPAGLGGSSAICAAIAEAAVPVLAQRGIAAGSVAVAVEVKSQHRISAVASVSGRRSPEQNVGISDRPLNPRAVDMLAQSVADALSGLVK